MRALMMRKGVGELGLSRGLREWGDAANLSLAGLRLAALYERSGGSDALVCAWLSGVRSFAV